MEYLTAFDLSPSGDRIALTARGQVFVAPAKKGRLVEVTRKAGVRYREARFLPDGKSVVALSDESGEVELWKLPANGVGSPEQLTTDGKVLRWEALPVARRQVDRPSRQGPPALAAERQDPQEQPHRDLGYSDFQDLDWSPDGRWLAWAVAGPNTFQRIFLYDTSKGRTVPVTSDRFNSWSPAWSPDGKWLWFLSDRELRTLVQGPWGTRQPDPFLTATNKIFGVALKKVCARPSSRRTSCTPNRRRTRRRTIRRTSGRKEGQRKRKERTTRKRRPRTTRRRWRSISTASPSGWSRCRSNPATSTPSRSTKTACTGWSPIPRSRTSRPPPLMTVAFSGEKPEAKTVAEGIVDYQLSDDGKKLAVRKPKALYVFTAGDDSPDDLDSVKVDLSGWAFAIDPKEQWRQMFNRGLAPGAGLFLRHEDARGGLARPCWRSIGRCRCG